MTDAGLGTGNSGLLGDVLSRLSGSNPSLVTGEAGGGAVRVTLQGLQRVKSVTIAEDVRADLGILEDLVAAAFNDALERARAATQEAALGLFKQLSQE